MKHIEETLKIKCIHQNEKNYILAEEINQLTICSKWKECFLGMCYARGISKLSSKTKSQLINIGEVDSKPIYTLAQFGKKVGFEMLEYLSVEIDNEHIRQKAVNLIFKQGVKLSKNELALIVSEARHKKTLFDF